MKNKLFNFILSVALALLLSLAVVYILPPWAAQANGPAAIRYLSPSGSDSGACTNPSLPCKTVQYAIDQAASGDELRLASGLYNAVQNTGGHSQVALIGKTVGLFGGFNATFTSRDPDVYTTTLDGSSQGRLIFASGAITVTLDGLQLLNGSSSTDPSGFYPGGGIYASGASLVIVHSRIQNCKAGYGDGNGIHLTGGTLIMENSVVQQNLPYWGENASHRGGGLYVFQSTVTISHSEFISNTAGLNGYTGAGYGGGAYFDSSSAVLDEVVFRGNRATTGESGYGGGLGTYKGSLQLLNSNFINNTAGGLTTGYGGGLHLRTANAILSHNHFANNNTSPNGEVGRGGAIEISYLWGSELTANRFENNHCTGWSCFGGAISAENFGPLRMQDNQFVSNTAGGVGGALYLSGPSLPASMVVLRNNLVQANLANTNGGGAHLTGTVDLLYNRFINNHANQSGGGIYLREASSADTGTAIVDGNLLKGNSAAVDGGGLRLETTFSQGLKILVSNMAVLNNSAGGKGGGIYIYRYTNAPTTFYQLTLSGNTAGDQSTIYHGGGKLVISNTILSNGVVGIDNRGVLGLNRVLFSGLVTNTKTIYYGVVNPNITFSGNPAFAADGYHLTASSAAIDGGGASGLLTDIDGQPRMLGMAPDLGADESPYSKAGSGMQAWLTASEPAWKVFYTGKNSPPSTYFEQTYLIPFANYNPAQAVSNFTIQQQLPPVLNLIGTTMHPTLTLGVNGSSLSWASQAALQPGGWGWVGTAARSTSIAPGSSVNTSGHLSYNLANGDSGQINFQNSGKVPARPVFPPVLLSPENGEMCLDANHQLNAYGLASAGSTVQLFENGLLKASVTATSAGEFNIDWNSAMTYTRSVTIYTITCEAGAGCSKPSRSIHLEYPKGNWCPQRSFWEGTVNGTHYIYHFLNARGTYATNDFQIPGVNGFSNTLLHLYSCCQGSVNPFIVLADGKKYTTAESHTGHWWTFNIQGAHDVTISSNCSGGGASKPDSVSYGVVLIDPDGFVFDQAKGGAYDPLSGMYSPNQPLPGITVTAYYSAPEWNSWIPWPAHLFNNQANPQVTGANGYFAFFTPPGLYYLEATGKNGYQSWRSPVIEVITQVVHMNAPLSWYPTAAPALRIKVTPSGLSMPDVTVRVNSSIEWQVFIDDFTTPEALTGLTANPLQRLLSVFNPLTNPAGWDSGMLVPGRIFRRQFTTPGVFNYTDGFGHSGKVTVLDSYWQIYLPKVNK